MLGERYSNGKISKNEYYSVLDFVTKLKMKICLVPRQFSLWDRITKRKEYLEHKEQALVNESFKVLEERLIANISDMIYADDFGKKKNKNR